jgi:hypothetical protein
MQNENIDNNQTNSNELKLESLELGNSKTNTNSDKEKDLFLFDSENFISKNFENFSKGKKVINYIIG